MVAGGVIPAEDYDHLKENGASLIFGPGTKITDASNSIIELVEKNLWFEKLKGIFKNFGIRFSL